jgi:hypothetical protein
MESILSSILPAWLLEKTSTISQTQLIFSLGTLAVLLIQIFGQAVRFSGKSESTDIELTFFCALPEKSAQLGQRTISRITGISDD